MTDLKKTNGLFSDQMLRIKKEIKIPKNEEKKSKENISELTNKEKISEFVKITKCHQLEAKQYLEENSFDLDAALTSRNSRIHNPIPIDSPLLSLRQVSDQFCDFNLFFIFYFLFLFYFYFLSID